MAKILMAGRVVVAMVPLFLASMGARTYAQEMDRREHDRLERRVAAIEIADARQDERWVAVMARQEAQDKTLWWLVLAVFGSSGVSGLVATDRAIHRLKARAS